MGKVYTDAERDLIALRLSEACSASVIGAEIGVSRNAIIGLVSRDARLRQIGFQSPQARHRTKIRATSKPRAPRAVRQPSIPTIVAVPTFLDLPMSELRHGQCKFAVNDAPPGETHLFCGSDTGGGSWCPYHQSVVYKPPKQRKKAREQATGRMAA